MFSSLNSQLYSQLINRNIGAPSEEQRPSSHYIAPPLSAKRQTNQDEKLPNVPPIVHQTEGDTKPINSLYIVEDDEDLKQFPKDSSVSNGYLAPRFPSKPEKSDQQQFGNSGSTEKPEPPPQLYIAPKPHTDKSSSVQPIDGSRKPVSTSNSSENEQRPPSGYVIGKFNGPAIGKPTTTQPGIDVHPSKNFPAGIKISKVPNTSYLPPPLTMPHSKGNIRPQNEYGAPSRDNGVQGNSNDSSEEDTKVSSEETTQNKGLEAVNCLIKLSMDGFSMTVIKERLCFTSSSAIGIEMVVEELTCITMSENNSNEMLTTKRICMTEENQFGEDSDSFGTSLLCLVSMNDTQDLGLQRKKCFPSSRNDFASTLTILPCLNDQNDVIKIPTKGKSFQLTLCENNDKSGDVTFLLTSLDGKEEDSKSGQFLCLQTTASASQMLRLGVYSCSSEQSQSDDQVILPCIPLKSSWDEKLLQPFSLDFTLETCNPAEITIGNNFTASVETRVLNSLDKDDRDNVNIIDVKEKPITNSGSNQNNVFEKGTYLCLEANSRSRSGLGLSAKTCSSQPSALSSPVMNLPCSPVKADKDIILLDPSHLVLIYCQMSQLPLEATLSIPDSFNENVPSLSEALLDEYLCLMGSETEDVDKVYFKRMQCSPDSSLSENFLFLPCWKIPLFGEAKISSSGENLEIVQCKVSNQEILNEDVPTISDAITFPGAFSLRSFPFKDESNLPNVQNKNSLCIKESDESSGIILKQFKCEAIESNNIANDAHIIPCIDLPSTVQQLALTKWLFNLRKCAKEPENNASFMSESLNGKSQFLCLSSANSADTPIGLQARICRTNGKFDTEFLPCIQLSQNGDGDLMVTEKGAKFNLEECQKEEDSKASLDETEENVCLASKSDKTSEVTLSKHHCFKSPSVVRDDSNIQTLPCYSLNAMENVTQNFFEIKQCLRNSKEKSIDFEKFGNHQGNYYNFLCLAAISFNNELQLSVEARNCSPTPTSNSEILPCIATTSGIRDAESSFELQTCERKSDVSMISEYFCLTSDQDGFLSLEVKSCMNESIDMMTLSHGTEFLPCLESPDEKTERSLKVMQCLITKSNSAKTELQSERLKFSLANSGNSLCLTPSGTPKEDGLKLAERDCRGTGDNGESDNSDFLLCINPEMQFSKYTFEIKQCSFLTNDSLITNQDTKTLSTSSVTRTFLCLKPESESFGLSRETCFTFSQKILSNSSLLPCIDIFGESSSVFRVRECLPNTFRHNVEFILRSTFPPGSPDDHLCLKADPPTQELSLVRKQCNDDESSNQGKNLLPCLSLFDVDETTFKIKTCRSSSQMESLNRAIAIDQNDVKPDSYICLIDKDDKFALGVRNCKVDLNSNDASLTQFLPCVKKIKMQAEEEEDLTLKESDLSIAKCEVKSPEKLAFDIGIDHPEFLLGNRYLCLSSANEDRDSLRLSVYECDGHETDENLILPCLDKDLIDLRSGNVFRDEVMSLKQCRPKKLREGNFNFVHNTQKIIKRMSSVDPLIFSDILMENVCLVNSETNGFLLQVHLCAKDDTIEVEDANFNFFPCVEVNNLDALSMQGREMTIKKCYEQSHTSSTVLRQATKLATKHICVQSYDKEATNLGIYPRTCSSTYRYADSENLELLPCSSLNLNNGIWIPRAGRQMEVIGCKKKDDQTPRKTLTLTEEDKMQLEMIAKNSQADNKKKPTLEKLFCIDTRVTDGEFSEKQCFSPAVQVQDLDTESLLCLSINELEEDFSNLANLLKTRSCLTREEEEKRQNSLALSEPEPYLCISGDLNNGQFFQRDCYPEAPDDRRKATLTESLTCLKPNEISEDFSNIENLLSQRHCTIPQQELKKTKEPETSRYMCFSKTGGFIERQCFPKDSDKAEKTERVYCLDSDVSDPQDLPYDDSPPQLLHCLPDDQSPDIKESIMEIIKSTVNELAGSPREEIARTVVSRVMSLPDAPEALDELLLFDLDEIDSISYSVRESSLLKFLVDNLKEEFVKVYGSIEKRAVDDHVSGDDVDQNTSSIIHNLPNILKMIMTPAIKHI